MSFHIYILYSDSLEKFYTGQSKYSQKRARQHRQPSRKSWAGQAQDWQEVFSDDVPEPVAVRYAWSNLPHGGLMNSRELPACPFRSDTWPLVPHQSTGSYEVGNVPGSR